MHVRVSPLDARFARLVQVFDTKCVPYRTICERLEGRCRSLRSYSRPRIVRIKLSFARFWAECHNSLVDFTSLSPRVHARAKFLKQIPPNLRPQCRRFMPTEFQSSYSETEGGLR